MFIQNEKKKNLLQKKSNRCQFIFGKSLEYSLFFINSLWKSKLFLDEQAGLAKWFNDNLSLKSTRGYIWILLDTLDGLVSIIFAIL